MKKVNKRLEPQSTISESWQCFSGSGLQTDSNSGSRNQSQSRKWVRNKQPEREQHCHVSETLVERIFARQQFTITIALINFMCVEREWAI